MDRELARAHKLLEREVARVNMRLERILAHLSLDDVTEEELDARLGVNQGHAKAYFDALEEQQRRGGRP